MMDVLKNFQQFSEIQSTKLLQFQLNIKLQQSQTK